MLMDIPNTYIKSIKLSKVLRFSFWIVQIFSIAFGIPRKPLYEIIATNLLETGLTIIELFPNDNLALV